MSTHSTYLSKLSLEGLGNLLPLSIASLGEHVYDSLLVGSCRGYSVRPQRGYLKSPKCPISVV